MRHSFGLTWFGTGASGTVHGSVRLNQIIKEFAFAFISAIVQVTCHRYTLFLGRLYRIIGGSIK